MSEIAKMINDKMRELRQYGDIIEDEKVADAEIPHQVVKVQIDWGDWKHDHLYIDRVVEELFGDKLLVEYTDVTEEDGSDCYSGIHTYAIQIGE